MSTLIQTVKNSKGKRCYFNADNKTLSLGYRGASNYTIEEVHDDRVILCCNSNPQAKRVVEFANTKIQLADDLKIG